MPNIEDLALRVGWPEEIMRDILNVPAAPRAVPLPEPGTPISVREASRKYAIAPDSISRWVTNPGLTIRVIQEPSRGGEPKLIDEHDLCIVINHWLSDEGRGRGKRNHLRKAALDLEPAVPTKARRTA